jgi:hypothetical protein
MFHIKSVEISRTQAHPYLGDLSTPSSIGTINVSSTYRLMMERCAVDATCRISAEAPRIDVFNTNSVDISRTQVHPLLGDLSLQKFTSP